MITFIDNMCDYFESVNVTLDRVFFVRSIQSKLRKRRRTEKKKGMVMIENKMNEQSFTRQPLLESVRRRV